MIPVTSKLKKLLQTDSIQEDAERIMDEIKGVESQFSEFAGVTEIKAKLAKSRRSLKGEEPDLTASIIYHEETMALLDAELAWRNQASGILAPLNRYNDAIRKTIGIRLQDRFSTYQAEEIASCLSEHRDVSLHF